jgi:hypothetical protein
MTTIINQRKGAVMFENLKLFYWRNSVFLRIQTLILAFMGPKPEVCVTFYDKVTPAQFLS